MKKLLFAGVATALALTGSTVRAEDDTTGSMGSDTSGSYGTGSQGSMGTGSTGSTGSMGTTGKTGSSMGTTGSMDSSMAMMGKVTNIDKKKNMVTLEVPISPTAQVMRDGKTVGLDQLKKGDDVRASFDPSTHTINQIHVEPKGASDTMNKQMKE